MSAWTTPGRLQESLNAAEQLDGRRHCGRDNPLPGGDFRLFRRSAQEPNAASGTSSERVEKHLKHYYPQPPRRGAQSCLPYVPVSCNGMGGRIQMFNSWLDGCPAGKDGCQHGVGTCTHSSSSARDYRISTATPPARRTGIANVVAARRRPGPLSPAPAEGSSVVSSQFFGQPTVRSPPLLSASRRAGGASTSSALGSGAYAHSSTTG